MTILQEIIKETGKTRWRGNAIQFLRGLEQKKILEMLNNKVQEYFVGVYKPPEWMEQ